MKQAPNKNRTVTRKEGEIRRTHKTYTRRDLNDKPVKLSYDFEWVWVNGYGWKLVGYSYA